MKDGRYDGTLQQLTPQKLFVSYGASRTHKGSSCNFRFHFRNFLFALASKGENGAGNSCVQIGNRAIQEFSRDKRSSHHDCVARHDPLLALGL